MVLWMCLPVNFLHVKPKGIQCCVGVWSPFCKAYDIYKCYCVFALLYTMCTIYSELNFDFWWKRRENNCVCLFVCQSLFVLHVSEWPFSLTFLTAHNTSIEKRRISYRTRRHMARYWRIGRYKKGIKGEDIGEFYIVFIMDQIISFKHGTKQL